MILVIIHASAVKAPFAPIESQFRVDFQLSLQPCDSGIRARQIASTSLLQLFQAAISKGKRQSKSGAEGPGSTVQDLGLDLELRVQGLELRVSGSGFRVLGFGV